MSYQDEDGNVYTDSPVSAGNPTKASEHNTLNENCAFLANVKNAHLPGEQMAAAGGPPTVTPLVTGEKSSGITIDGFYMLKDGEAGFDGLTIFDPSSYDNAAATNITDLTCRNIHFEVTYYSTTYAFDHAIEGLVWPEGTNEARLTTHACYADGWLWTGNGSLTTSISLTDGTADSSLDFSIDGGCLKMGTTYTKGNDHFSVLLRCTIGPRLVQG